MNTTTESQTGNADRQRVRSPLWNWSSRLIILAGTIWVIFLLSRDFRSLTEGFQVASYGWLAFTFIAGIAALLFLVPVFQLLLSEHATLRIGYVYAARMLFVAQLLRHLPGRIWGVAYLVVETRPTIPAGAMLRANLDTMIYATSFALLIAATLALGVLVSPVAAGACYAVGTVCMALAIRLNWLGRLVVAMARIIPGRIRSLVDALPTHQPVPWPVVTRVVVSIALSWACYLAIWWSFQLIFPVLEEINIWLLCASYAVAWFVGYISMITPAGLGVREASFFALAGTLTTLPNLAFLAVFVRIWQILTELCVFLLFAFVKPAISADNSAAMTEPKEDTRASEHEFE